MNMNTQQATQWFLQIPADAAPSVQSVMASMEPSFLTLDTSCIQPSGLVISPCYKPGGFTPPFTTPDPGGSVPVVGTVSLLLLGVVTLVIGRRLQRG